MSNANDDELRLHHSSGRSNRGMLATSSPFVTAAGGPGIGAWNVTAEEGNDVPNGGALLLAHYTILTFGNVIVAPIDAQQGMASNGWSAE